MTLLDWSFVIPMIAVMPFWALMILAPTWQRTRQIVQSPWIAVIPALAYAIVTLPNLMDVLPVFAPPTLDSLTQFLGTPAGAAIAWTHFLAFDLLIGRWIYLDSQRQGFSVILTGLILVPAFMLAPLGWLLYLLMRVLYAAARNDAAVAVHDPFAQRISSAD
jgi:hypothetical protein